jgi:hypothetical protein
MGPLMKNLLENGRGMSHLVWCNLDRVMIPLVIVSALVLARMIFDYRIVH